MSSQQSLIASRAFVFFFCFFFSCTRKFIKKNGKGMSFLLEEEKAVCFSLGDLDRSIWI